MSGCTNAADPPALPGGAAAANTTSTTFIEGQSSGSGSQARNKHGCYCRTPRAPSNRCESTTSAHLTTRRRRRLVALEEAHPERRELAGRDGGAQVGHEPQEEGQVVQRQQAIDEQLRAH